MNNDNTIPDASLSPVGSVSPEDAVLRWALLLGRRHWRHLEVLRARAEGESYPAIGEQHGVKWQRAQQLFNAGQERALRVLEGECVA